jgi:hypothetical protein
MSNSLIEELNTRMTNQAKARVVLERFHFIEPLTTQLKQLTEAAEEDFPTLKELFIEELEKLA